MAAEGPAKDSPAIVAEAEVHEGETNMPPSLMSQIERRLLKQAKKVIFTWDIWKCGLSFKTLPIGVMHTCLSYLYYTHA